jgi:hypothetical protein
MCGTFLYYIFTLVSYTFYNEDLLKIYVVDDHVTYFFIS